MALVTAIAMMLNIVAMACDLAAGLYKAKLRGEITTSQGLHRSVAKFLGYIGSLVAAFCVDMMLHFGHLWTVVHLDVLANVPVVVIVIGVFNCFVEIFSIREKANAKSDRQTLSQLAVIVRALKHDDVSKLLKLINKIDKEDEND